MKTFHRLMYENLTPDEWKELLKVGNVWAIRKRTSLDSIDFACIRPSVALNSYSFDWGRAEQGWQYWSDVFHRLLNAGK